MCRPHPHASRQLGLPIAALAGEDVRLALPTTPVKIPSQPFDAEAHEYHFPSVIAARLAIAIANDLAMLADQACR